MTGGSPDVVIVGAGPAGCACALALAQKDRRVLLLEADPRAADRLAGEWLHPPALDVLDKLGVDLRPSTPYPSGKGFVVVPDDGTEPIVLPYASGRFGMALEHGLLVETLRAECERDERIELSRWSCATRIDGQNLTYERRHGAPRTVRAPLIVGASGRAGHGAGPWKSPERPLIRSRIAGFVLEECELPFEGYFHMLLGAPGPVLAYRIDARRVRVLCDVPASLPVPREGGIMIYEAFASVMRGTLRDAFQRSVRSGPPAWASHELRPRSELGREGLALIGDAVGTHHPLSATGLTLALQDAAALAEGGSFSAYAHARARATRVPEMLAVGLYEVLADDAEESIAMRRAIFDLWRSSPGERLRSMGFLSGEDRSHARFGRSFLRAIALGSRTFAREALSTGRLMHTGRVASDLGARMAWLLGGTLHLTDALPHSRLSRLGAPRTAEARYGAALRASSARAEVVGLPRGPISDSSAENALRRGVRALLAEQDADGSFEGEVVWCPMLAAQYVLAWHAMGRPISEERRARLLKHFERTRLPSGTWGLHELSEPYLFVTTLVYVASRLLGLSKDDPLIARAHAFIRAEGGAIGIPSWGKLWLAIVNLYRWEGVSPVLPEIWLVPRWVPIHPSRYYCHTRLIYLAMSVVYGERWSAPASPRVLAIRDEIFVQEFDAIDFGAARETLRDEEIHTPWSMPLRVAYRAMTWADRLARSEVPGRQVRSAVLAGLREQIRYELRSTSHTCISPVSGLLDQIALHIEDPTDPDLVTAGERFEGWIWEDDDEGARVTGARSASWDSAFAAQTLAAAAPHVRGGELGAELEDAMRRCDAFLASQQIQRGTGREHEHDRIDPTGGYCFAGVWHGWPVSDCTAEAMLGRIECPVAEPALADMERAAEFILRTQNSDGGFGSYEARRVDISLEWLNPAEMFGDSMTEKSYVECTASCIAALAAFRHRWARSGGSAGSESLERRVDQAIERAVKSLRRAQRTDGSWPGMWGVHLIYGTMFGVRGLVTGGVPVHDPQVRRACQFLKDRQRPDGGWGEHHSSVLVGRYVDHDQPQSVQTAWAMTALLEARDPDFAAIERAAMSLSSQQRPDGTWPKQDPEGIFFHTAMLDYVLYRRYFPVWALGLYETRRLERARFLAPQRSIEVRPSA